MLEQSIRDSATELEKMVDRRTDELRRLSIRLMTMQDQERRRLARDLHDGLGQELAVAKMVLDRMIMEKPADRQKKPGLRPAVLWIVPSSKCALCLIFCIRRCSMKLACCRRFPGTWTGSPSAAALKRLSMSSPAEFPRLAAEVETAVFRIVQEALTNVFRHSEASKVWITLTQKDGLIVVAVRDDGKGIGKRIAELQPDSVGVGIGGMKQRAKEFGGELRLTNAQPGTLVELMIPSSSVLRQPSVVLDGCA